MLSKVIRSIPVLLLFWGGALAQDLTVAEAPAEGQVVQRAESGTASIAMSGSASKSSGAVEARVLSGAAALRGFDWKPIDQVKNGKWAGTLKDVPAGGPYAIELRVAGGAPVAIKDVFVGDLWILAGQSNMEGVGDLLNVEPPNEHVRTFDMMDKWTVATEPLHMLVGAADRVHWKKNATGEPERLEGTALAEYVGTRKKGAGLGLPFAVEMYKRTGTPIGLVPCAHGGTSMDQWSPDLKDRGGDSLYGATLRRFRLVGGKVKGILWYQGESDANPKAEPEFAGKFDRLIRAFRADFGEPNLPFYYVQIGRHVNGANQVPWNKVQEAQLRAESTIPNVAMAPSVDFDLDDQIHVDTQEHKRLAKRIANLATSKHGPRPVSARLEGNIVRVTFTGVNGRLTHVGRLSGFSIHDADDQPVAMIFRQEVDPENPSSVLLYLGNLKLPAKASVHYGYGKDPYANLNDELDMGAPAFGPMAIEQP